MLTRRSKPVSAINIKTGEEILFPSLAEFVRAVGCTYIHANRVISSKAQNRYYSTCKGYSLRYLDADEIQGRKDEIA